MNVYFGYDSNTTTNVVWTFEQSGEQTIDILGTTKIKYQWITAGRRKPGRGLPF